MRYRKKNLNLNRLEKHMMIRIVSVMTHINTEISLTKSYMRKPQNVHCKFNIEINIGKGR